MQTEGGDCWPDLAGSQWLRIAAIRSYDTVGSW
jgi:hypothetical protein